MDKAESELIWTAPWLDGSYNDDLQVETHPDGWIILEVMDGHDMEGQAEQHLTLGMCELLIGALQKAVAFQRGRDGQFSNG